MKGLTYEELFTALDIVYNSNQYRIKPKETKVETPNTNEYLTFEEICNCVANDIKLEYTYNNKQWYISELTKNHSFTNVIISTKECKYRKLILKPKPLSFLEVCEAIKNDVLLRCIHKTTLLLYPNLKLIKGNSINNIIRICDEYDIYVA